MERREAQGWQPTHCLTEAVVDLEGVAVRTCWLEEQLLVDLRRGRLERAARYLPLCDRDRLLALLRGQVDTVERL
ncbi:hypothetical protein, partial [Brucella melitensis]|uniref:hypothetical protein n=1 Tax=Brucella melitensis TaxID=29459 RepID=UPI003B682745